MSAPPQIKCVVIGDGAVGKTCLLISRTSNSFPKLYVPTVFDNYQLEMELEGTPVIVDLWDTAGQEDFDRLRPLSYPKTHVFLVCFSIISSDSLDNVDKKWVPEISHHAPNVPFLLIGTKSDFRNNREMKAELEAQGLQIVSAAEAKAMASKTGAIKYLECSALTRENVDEVFNETVRSALSKESGGKAPKKRTCLVL